jgi:AcrR family transcriptional regulator
MVRRREAGTTGRPALSRQRALEAAVALADAGGIAAVTMRGLAHELGVEAMSLYHHVRNKDDLLDGMVDVVFAEILLPPTDVDWKTAMRLRAHSMRDTLVRHPWSIAVLETRATPGLATLRHHDAVLGCLRAGGFTIAATGHAYAVLDAFIYGFASQQIQLPFDTGEETQQLAEDILTSMPVDQFPHLAEFAVERAMKPGYSYAAEFDVGLELILDGLEKLVNGPEGSPA